MVALDGPLDTTPRGGSRRAGAPPAALAMRQVTEAIPGGPARIIRTPLPTGSLVTITRVSASHTP
jgi:hypothetical protein